MVLRFVYCLQGYELAILELLSMLELNKTVSAW